MNKVPLNGVDKCTLVQGDLYFDHGHNLSARSDLLVRVLSEYAEAGRFSL
jgi:hypothetical protein